MKPNQYNQRLIDKDKRSLQGKAMTTVLHWENDVRNNPLQRLETMLLFRRRGKWFWRGVFALTIILFLVPFFYNRPYDFDNAVEITTVLLGTLNLGAMIMLVLRAANFGGNTLGRELNGRTWEMLILTGVDARRLVIGKWLGVFRYMLRDALWLVTVRMMVMFWVLVMHQMNMTYDYVARQGVVFSDIGMNLSWLPPMLLLTTLFVFLEIGLSAALGMMTAMRRHRVGAAGSIAIRFGVPGLLIFGTLLYIGFAQHNCNLRTNYDWSYCNAEMEPLAEVLALPGFSVLTFFDNANMTPYILVDAYYNPNYYDSVDNDTAFFFRTVYGGYLLAMLLYVGGIVGGLSLAVWRVGRLGANQLGFSYKRKAKREYSLPDSPAESVAPPLQPKTEPREMQVVYGVENLLKLAEPDAYQVALFSYQKAFKRAILHVYGQGESFYVEFHGVRYLQSPAMLSGAGLHAEENKVGALHRFMMGDQLVIEADTLVKRQHLA